MRNKNKSVLFDFDGTLVDSFPVALKVSKEVAKKNNLPNFDDNDVLRWRSMRPVEIMNELGIGFHQVPLLLLQLRSLYKQYLPDIQFFNGIDTLLNRLSNNYQCGIITSNSKDSVVTLLKNNSIQCIDDKNIKGGASLGGKSKKISNLLKSQNISNINAVYITDETRDIDECKKLNLTSIAVSWGFQSREVLATSSPFAIVDTIEELEEMIRLVLN